MRMILLVFYVCFNSGFIPMANPAQIIERVCFCKGEFNQVALCILSLRYCLLQIYGISILQVGSFKDRGAVFEVW